MAIPVLLVDDEPLARKRMRALLRDYPDVAIAGEAPNGETAVRLIEERRPQVVFLDVQMPRMNGFDVVRAISAEMRPLIVFVTAFEQYALDAFRASAVQYLLKPVERADLREAMTRVRQLVSAPEPVCEPSPYLQRVTVKTRGRTLVFRIEEVDWFESAGNYVTISAGGGRYLLRETMAALETKLDPRRFVRIHRTVIVNLERIRETQRVLHGKYVVVLRDGTRLRLSRAFRERIQPLIGRL